MNNWKRKWREELDEVMPNLKESVQAYPIPEKQNGESLPVRKLFVFGSKFYAIATAIFAVILAVCLTLVFALRNPTQVTPVATSYAAIVEINPKVMFSVDKSGKVTAVIALTEDADVILSSEKRLNELERRCGFAVERRRKEKIKTIALVGYTNTGKSTLLNLLTNSDVYVKNELFATLDPTARSFSICDVNFLLIDTVGFLQALPHNLISAFHSTLESALSCDLALIVCDGTGNYQMQLDTTLKTLEELKFNLPHLIVINKTENISDTTLFPFDSIPISAKTGKGIQTLKAEILKSFASSLCFCELFVPYNQLTEYSKQKNLLTERSTEFTNDGLIVNAVIADIYAEKFTQYLSKRIPLEEIIEEIKQA